MRRLCPLFALLTVFLSAFVAGVGGTDRSPIADTQRPEAPGGVASQDGFAGSNACSGCHQAQSQAWRGSHHAHAMFDAARPGAVLGDFSGQSASAGRRSARFFRDQGRFFVEIDGRDGAPARFAISHSFGWTPLQQYLVTMPDGRIQVLPWAWDTRPAGDGGQRWFNIYGDESIPPNDQRHWTNVQQNWNHMCAECHTTGFEKGYQPETARFESRWSELGVGCESCHGPAAGHVRWAGAGAAADDARKGFDGVQPRIASFPAIGDRREVDACARCHSRRIGIDPRWRPGQPFLDGYRPVLLTQDMFEHDGQMKDEVFNDHSFRQSLMSAKGVTCGHCHEPHSGALRQPGVAVCSQCHEEARFKTAAHSGHAAGPGAPDCISCHMPSRTYMQIDKRHDHSFRVPRPDLSERTSSPNACQACHADKTPAWAAAAIERWHPGPRKGFQTFGAAFRDSRAGDVAAREALQRLARDSAVPAIARATALAELSAWPAQSTDRVLFAALSDADPIIRAAAASGHEGLAPEVRRRRLLPLLKDPVRMVRISTAAVLADLRATDLDGEQAAALSGALAEYEASLLPDRDRPEARIALGGLRLRQGRTAEAEAEYRSALTLDSASIPGAVNLADLLRRTGRESAAEAILRNALSHEPRASSVHYALGLSLLRSRRSQEALASFRAAVEAETPQARHYYAYGLALQSAGHAEDARAILRKGVSLFPADVDLNGALLQDATRNSDRHAARELAAHLARLRPDDASLQRLKERFERP